jgi:uncharacterized protein YaiI (UPF0178 family)
MKIIVDADACPKSILRICMELGAKYKVPVWTVASFNHIIDSSHHIMVGNASQETDIKIMNLANFGDVVITHDYGLAAMILSKQAWVIHPNGWEYKPDTINFLLEEREAKARFRRGGGRTKGPKKRDLKDDKEFERCLENVLIRGMKK